MIVLPAASNGGHPSPLPVQLPPFVILFPLSFMLPLLQFPPEVPLGQLLSGALSLLSALE